MLSLSGTCWPPLLIISTRWGQGTGEHCHGLMSVSQWSIQLASGLQAPQIRADRLMQVKQDPSPNVNSEHNVLCSSTQLDYTHTDLLTLTAANREGWGGLGGDWGSEREDRATLLLHYVWAEIRAGQHSAAHQSRSYQTGFCSSLEHLILLTVTEVTALRRRTHNKLRSVFQLECVCVCVSTSGVLACVND